MTQITRPISQTQRYKLHRVHTPVHQGFGRRLEQLLITVFDTLIAWQDRANMRHSLQQMDDYLLRDIGLSRADIEAEAEKPFWHA